MREENDSVSFLVFSYVIDFQDILRISGLDEDNIFYYLITGLTGGMCI